MSRAVMLVLMLGLVTAGLLGWVYYERTYVWATDKGRDRVYRERLAADIIYTYSLTLEGKDASLQLVSKYINSLEQLARWHESDAVKLNTYAELRLACGRLALAARRRGDAKEYTRRMRQALVASQRYSDIMDGYGGGSYLIDTEAQMLAFVRRMEVSSVMLTQRGMTLAYPEEIAESPATDEPLAPPSVEN